MAGTVKREHRKRVRIRAEMRVDSTRIEVVICNVSSRGLMLAAEDAPPRGSYIELSRAGVTTVARVVWANNGRFGVRTHDKLNVEAMMHTPAAGARCLSVTTSAGIDTPKVRTFGKAYVHGLHHVERAERSSWAGARMQFAAVAAGAVLMTMLAAYIVYRLLLGMSSAVIAGLA